MELVAYIEGQSTLEAMLAVVNIDHLKGINYRLCKRDGCDNIFEVTRPDKVFCGHPCAHKAHIYEKREEARKAKKKAALAREAPQKVAKRRK